MSYYGHPDPSSSYPSSTSSNENESAELKLYQAFIFSVPIFFTFILLFLFYLFYLRRRRVDWPSLQMRSSLENNSLNDLSRAEMGLKKELREMLPIIIYKESFSIKDIQCSVCLADYLAEDKLQQIPACGHAFHMDCIDHWLATHTTCPLCRLSLIPSAKAPIESPDTQEGTSQESSLTENGDGASDQPISEACEETRAIEHPESRNRNAGAIENNSEVEETSQCFDQGTEFQDTRNETENDDHSRRIPA
ncbi:RING-H2 finger protein ATL7-like isoform X2 [Mangifera indica]|uniref:RING-H2 finger protein ATL7-like isoform X2 n=1 Tax=Mangifera indica TaxID=29780 RepID=UPI001CF96C02|nr:RING-H2 finger protein ATL7-like isoform X2 [Mangifera indica]